MVSSSSHYSSISFRSSLARNRGRLRRYINVWLSSVIAVNWLSPPLWDGCASLHGGGGGGGGYLAPLWYSKPARTRTQHTQHIQTDIGHSRVPANRNGHRMTILYTREWRQQANATKISMIHALNQIAGIRSLHHSPFVFISNTLKIIHN